jgi:hypothetical protein
MGLSVLLNESPQSAYWIGFIMADGHLTEKRLVVTLAKRDEAHLNTLGAYLELGRVARPLVKAGAVCLTRQEPSVVQAIRSRFDFRDRKTYNPPSKLPYKGDNLVSFLVGFIDGDGSINLQTGRKTCALRTVSSPEWYSFLKQVSEETGFGRVTLRADGYVTFGIHRHLEIVRLKQQARRLHLPFLSRKWDRVDEGLTVRGQMQYAIINMIRNDHTTKEILEETGCSKAYVSVLRKRERSTNDHVLHE